MSQQYNNGSLFLTGVLCGSVIGTLTTLLFTTTKGKEIQDKMIDTFEGIEEKTKKGLHSSGEKIKETKDKAKEKLHGVEQKVSQAEEKIK